MAGQTPARVLMVAYFFPPLGGAGVQRSLKLAKYLPEQGWEPTVVTVRSQDYWMADASLAEEMRGRVRVLRTRSVTGLSLARRLSPREAGAPGRPRPSGGRFGLLRRAAGWFWLPDAYRGWVPFARYASGRLLARQRHQLIYTTSSPDSAHLIGRDLMRRFGVPWVADFRDPWTRRMSYNPPTAWHDRRHRRLEEAVLREASHITVTAEATRRDYLQRYPQIPPEKISVVTNGYDEEDFAGQPDAALSSDRLTILHAGQLNPERRALPMLRALRRFLQRRPEASSRVRVRFVGAFYQHDLDDAARLDLGDQVSFEPPRAHREIIRELLSSHVLLLMEQESDRGGLILPGKVFEYLRSGRPILGLLPRGAAWDLIAQHEAGACCRTGDTEAAADLLERYFDEFVSTGQVAPTRLSEATLAQYERRQLTARMAAIFDRLRG